MKKAAIFDIDGTIIRNVSSERVFFRYLLARGEVTFRDILRFALMFIVKILQFKGIYLRKNKYYLKNKEYGKVVSGINVCFHEQIASHISPHALHEIDRLKKAGYLIVLLSGTLSPLVERFREYCNADVGVGTGLAVDKEGKITGEVDGIHSYSGGKVKAVNRLVVEYGIDLSSSYAFANQYIDVKFMRMVGYPVAVNASLMLRLYAAVKRWKVIKF